MESNLKPEPKIKIKEYSDRADYRKKYLKKYMEENKEYYKEYKQRNKDRLRQNTIRSVVKKELDVYKDAITKRDELKALEQQLKTLQQENKQLIVDMNKQIDEVVLRYSNKPKRNSTTTNNE